MMASTLVKADEAETECNTNATVEQCASQEAEKLAEQGTFDRFWFDKTFDPARERVFSRLQAEFEQDPWAICTLRLGSQPKYYVDKQLREQTAMDVFNMYTKNLKIKV
jgi:hypothetical protein